MKEKISLKDILFNELKVRTIALEIKLVYSEFEDELFVKDVLEMFPKLELKARMYHIRDMFTKYLPQEYLKAMQILLTSLPPELDHTKTDNDFGEFIYASYAEFVVFHGCKREYLLFSLDALRQLTKRFSVEFAIRAFINMFPKETLEMLYECSLSENYHERRLASEGLRPNLPWAKKITIAYTKPLQHLDTLFYDNTRYVTRSVANHLNDIAKKDAPLVLETLKKWRATKKQTPKEMEYIINHALRTLVKRGESSALDFLGFSQNPALKIDAFKLHYNEVKIGDALLFECVLYAKEDVKLIIDYLIYFRTKTGTLNPKVHKLKKLVLKKGESFTLQKKHLFKAHMTTRTLYEGEHKIALQINGNIVQSQLFILKR